MALESIQDPLDHPVHALNVQCWAWWRC